ncbi:MAG: Asp23/Gls24 family envelope stress response protein [Bacillota bacterium]|jgi:uncharacterized alkaline shock family protein YloU
MSQVITNEIGQIIISDEVIATIAGIAALECYGLVGMCSRSKLKDNFVELLGRENLSRGVEVSVDDNHMEISLYIIVGYGTKISEVAQNVMDTVKYTVENLVGLQVDQVNVNVQGVRVNQTK